jgi:hypothetical protein
LIGVVVNIAKTNGMIYIGNGGHYTINSLIKNDCYGR